MRLGIPNMPVGNKLFCVRGQQIPFFAVLGTSANYSRMFQDSQEFKTPGSTTVGRIRVEFLNPDLTPYNFHGKEHGLTLVFVYDADTALLRCS